MAARAEVMQVRLVDKGENIIVPSARLPLVVAAIGVARPHIPPATGGKEPVLGLVPETPQSHLLAVVQALCPPARLTG